MEMRKICTGCRDGIDFDIPFAMAFQPIVDTRTGRPFAYEALIRGLGGEGAYSVLSQVTEANRYSFDQACRVKAIETAMAAGIMTSGARLSINFLPNAVYSPMACIQLTLRTAQAAGLPIDRSTEGLARWRDGLAALAACPNVDAKISGLGMTDPQWTEQSLRPIVETVIAAFGVERCMFGSNFPIDRLYAPYSRYMEVYRSLTAGFSAAARDALFWRTAARAYRIDLPPAATGHLS